MKENIIHERQITVVPRTKNMKILKAIITEEEQTTYNITPDFRGLGDIIVSYDTDSKMLFLSRRYLHGMGEMTIVRNPDNADTVLEMLEQNSPVDVYYESPWKKKEVA